MYKIFSDSLIFKVTFYLYLLNRNPDLNSKAFLIYIASKNKIMEVKNTSCIQTLKTSCYMERRSKGYSVIFDLDYKIYFYSNYDESKMINNKRYAFSEIPVSYYYRDNTRILTVLL